ncbi:MAG TPA: glycosyltransferase [Verrucomicrobiae bacterium]|nr:glycosyltransferase [Verrucomicrobiae bacterium]
MSAATVVITTKNRMYDLRKAVNSAMAQTGRPEVLVIDDGSTDGTPRMMAKEFPQVAFVRSETSQGYIAQRNRAAERASSRILFSIDDDAVFSAPDIVERTLEQFDHPRVGAVAIPFVDVNRSAEIKNKAPSSSQVFASYTYIGTAHAVRRDLFLQLGQYREELVHQGEEEDFCTRMLASGFITRPGTSAPIHHFESLQRDWTRMDFYGSRNKILYAWCNVPGPYLVTHLAATTVKTLLYNLHPRRFRARLLGVLKGYGLILRHGCRRAPVPAALYRLSRRIKMAGMLPLQEVEPELPELALSSHE